MESIHTHLGLKEPKQEKLYLPKFARLSFELRKAWFNLLIQEVPSSKICPRACWFN
ncbi:hypothetical protein MANES_08G015250v8 [Manihot esculenta]|uniref:Uncharacterized protein n=1 Tax=Manihot esculenta TaxID=3983 RepID=A0ACB7H9U3_MANES|nr:hypothetical protein MANES_08G015250v8 [Manihot esculenta]